MDGTAGTLPRLRRKVRALVRLCVLLLTILAAPASAIAQAPRTPPPPPNIDFAELNKKLEALGHEAANGNTDAPRQIQQLLEATGMIPKRSLSPYIIADTDAGTFFTGMITPKAMTALQQRIASAKNQTALIIDSPGGYDDAAIELGRFLLDRKMRVVVRNRCVSACANYIFLPAFEKVVEPNSIVAFHSSVLWWDQMAREGRIEKGHVDLEAQAQTAKKGSQLLKDASVARDLNEVLICMAEYIEPKLDSIKPVQVKNEEGEELPTFTVDTGYALAILSKSNARYLGIPGIVDFWWGNSFEETRLSIERALGKGRYTFGSLGSSRQPCPKGASGRLPAPWTPG